ncbi:hypothetical protein F0521_36350 [Ferrimonas sp. YFM]|nr:hypothetical protein F0521_36350 [Ferrimonas sp. YFM]
MLKLRWSYLWMGLALITSAGLLAQALVWLG